MKNIDTPCQGNMSCQLMVSTNNHLLKAPSNEPVPCRELCCAFYVSDCLKKKEGEGGGINIRIQISNSYCFRTALIATGEHTNVRFQITESVVSSMWSIYTIGITVSQNGID